MLNPLSRSILSMRSAVVRIIKVLLPAECSRGTASHSGCNRHQPVHHVAYPAGQLNPSLQPPQQNFDVLEELLEQDETVSNESNQVCGNFSGDIYVLLSSRRDDQWVMNDQQPHDDDWQRLPGVQDDPLPARHFLGFSLASAMTTSPYISDNRSAEHGLFSHSTDCSAAPQSAVT